MEKIKVSIGCKLIGFCLGRAGNHHTVEALERFKDDKGTEKTRWIFSEKKFFDTIDDALNYIKLHENDIVS